MNTVPLPEDAAMVADALTDLPGLLEALARQKQLDRDGCEVGVSRQAVDYAAALIRHYAAGAAAVPAAVPVAWRITCAPDTEGNFGYYDNAIAVQRLIEQEYEVVPLYAAPAAEELPIWEMVDALLNHCPIDECMKCSEIVCKHHEPLHLHHDGCPACSQYGGWNDAARGRT